MRVGTDRYDAGASGDNGRVTVGTVPDPGSGLGMREPAAGALTIDVEDVLTYLIATADLRAWPRAVFAGHVGACQ